MAKNETAPVAQAAPVTQAAPLLKFTKTKLITIPLLKLEIDKPVYVTLTGVMFVGKEVKGVGDKTKMEPAVLCHCTNLETGEPMQIIVNAVIKENLSDSYPDNSYVGKSFEFIKHEKREGKRYNDFSIAEIEVQ